ncbi:chromate efflux transporter [Marinobacterium sp. YM272]|uniref:chromate efflux transporter n=1 Tax=Marinobacterium sp. YM272 TaxID=3421654 RepID=UPI003D7FB5EF
MFWVFLKLGLTSFGGPVAHLGYFREAFVRRRCWLSDAQYSELVALCQILPGPASSQVGMGIGMSQAGYPGLLAAWLGFTLPSALMLILAAYGLAQVESVWLDGVIAGLKLVAVVVVAQALLGMYRSLVSGTRRLLIMFTAAGSMLLLGAVWSQLLVILLAGLAGRLWLGQQTKTAPHTPLTFRGVSSVHGYIWLAMLVLLLAGLPVLGMIYSDAAWRLMDGLVRAGALVFGGGHVVLPLLQNEVVATGLVQESQFLAGYGLAQAVPGPLFTLASYLGAAFADPAAGLPVALGFGLLATLAIFLPAFLLFVGVLPFWQQLQQRPGMHAALAGINAAVVGLLLAAWWNPVIISAVQGMADIGLLVVLAGLVWRGCPVWLLVLAGAAGGALLTLLA